MNAVRLVSSSTIVNTSTSAMVWLTTSLLAQKFSISRYFCFSSSASSNFSSAAFCCICSNTCCESWRVLPFKISRACAIAAW